MCRFLVTSKLSSSNTSWRVLSAKWVLPIPGIPIGKTTTIRDCFSTAFFWVVSLFRTTMSAGLGVSYLLIDFLCFLGWSATYFAGSTLVTISFFYSSCSMETSREGGSYNLRTTMRSSSELRCMRAGLRSLIKFVEFATLIIFSTSLRTDTAEVRFWKLLWA